MTKSYQTAIEYTKKFCLHYQAIFTFAKQRNIFNTSERISKTIDTA